MYAIIETGGKQYRVQVGDVITVEKLDVEVGKKVKFDKVLVLGEGKDIKVGTPYVGSEVEGKVVEAGKGDKVIIFKYKAKKDYHKKQGHRQPYTKVEITAIGGEVKAAPKAEAPKKAAAPKKEAAPKAEAKKEEAPKAEAPKKVSASMKKDELIAYAKANKIEIDEKATKAVILEAIEKASK